MKACPPGTLFLACTPFLIDSLKGYRMEIEQDNIASVRKEGCKLFTNSLKTFTEGPGTDLKLAIPVDLIEVK